MNFYHHHKVSLVDYPGKIATLLFVSGCNFKCEYCYNRELWVKKPHTVSEGEVIKFLEKRKNLIEAVAITGGEPGIYTDEIYEFFKKIKSLFPELLLKVDTNGSFPQFIEKMGEVADYIAMDFKSIDYSSFSSVDMKIIYTSLEKIKKTKDYEIRITMFPPYIKIEDFPKIGEILKGHKRVVIQQYRPVENLNVFPYEKEILNKFKNILQNYEIKEIIVKM